MRNGGTSLTMKRGNDIFMRLRINGIYGKEGWMAAFGVCKIILSLKGYG